MSRASNHLIADLRLADDETIATVIGLIDQIRDQVKARQVSQVTIEFDHQYVDAFPVPLSTGIISVRLTARGGDDA